MLFDYTFTVSILGKGAMTGNRVNAVYVVLLLGTAQAVITLSGTPCRAQGQSHAASPASVSTPASKKEQKSQSKLSANEKRFAARAESLLTAGIAGQGQWGALVVDADSGDVLYQRNADKYFVPASNMKLLTSALALAKLGTDYRFRTTVETRGALSADGMLSSDVVLVGRGDPNLSNRKFPFEGKEEFVGPPEQALSELADAVVARGSESTEYAYIDGKASPVTFWFDSKTRRPAQGPPSIGTGEAGEGGRGGGARRKGHLRRRRGRRQLFSGGALSRRLGNRRHGLGIWRGNLRDRGERQHRKTNAHTRHGRW